MTSGNTPPTNPKTAKLLSSAAKKAASRKASASSGVPAPRQIPWITIGAVAVVVALIGAIAFVLMPKFQDHQQRKEIAEKFTPSPENPDPSKDIAGIEIKEYKQGLHVQATQRVAYDQSPPFGGPHDADWADCQGSVYATPIRSENYVHGLEHGAVWVAYNPDKVSGSDLDKLKERVSGKPYTAMSPYPGLKSSVAMLAWGHRLELDSVSDRRIDEFIAALRQNENTAPEPGGTCSSITFDPKASPFVAQPPAPGPGTIPMDGTGANVAAEEGGLAPAPAPAPEPAAPLAPAP